MLTCEILKCVCGFRSDEKNFLLHRSRLRFRRTKTARTKTSKLSQKVFLGNFRVIEAGNSFIKFCKKFHDKHWTFFYKQNKKLTLDSWRKENSNHRKHLSNKIQMQPFQ